MIVVAKIDGREFVLLSRVVQLPLQHISLKTVKMPSQQALAVGFARPFSAGVRGAGVHHCGLGPLDANTHSLEVLNLSRHKDVMNEKLPSAGFHDGLPLDVGEDARGSLVSQAGADQLGCLGAIPPQLVHDQQSLKSAEQHVDILVHFKGCDTGIASVQRIEVKGLG